MEGLDFVVVGFAIKDNTCADKIPNNSFPGWDVYVNGKNFDVDSV